MPEMHFRIRWPDGKEELCYSPSLVIEEHLQPGTSYSLPAFVERAHTALGIASERVRARYGVACSRALGQLAIIEQRSRSFETSPGAEIMVLDFERMPPR